MLRLLISAIILLISALSGYAQSWGDYTLYSPKGSTKAYLVDLSGNIYKTWTFASGKKTGYSTYLLPGGVILRTVERQGNYFTGGPICGEVQKVDWNGNVVWDYVYSTQEYCTHHDICPMPNGNVLLIAYEVRNPSQVSAAGCSQSITMWPDKIVEVQPVGSTGGNVVWEWHAWDHLSQSLYPSKANYVSSIVQHPGLLNINYKTQKDWLHVNGIDYNEQLDQITFSSHNMNELYVIDHSTTTAEAASHTGGNSGKGGDLLYRWGNPPAYQATGTVDFNVVHDAHWVPAGCPRANYLAGFNNQGGPGGKSCIDLIAPPYDGYNYSGTPGSAYLPSTYTWRHTYNGTPTTNEGNSQQLPNGNMLVNISFSGYMYEIDSNQNVVWSKTISGTNTSAFRYSACYVNSIGYANATVSSPAICVGSTVQLDAEGIGGSDYSYTWTSNPPGFSSNLKNPTDAPLTATTYIVTITSGNCSVTDSVKVLVNSFPSTPSISFRGDSLLSSSLSGNQWYMNGNPIQGATLPYYIPVLQGIYQVAVTENGCQSDLSEPFIFTGTGNIPRDSIRLYPVPSAGLLNLEGIPPSGNTVACIFSSTGRVMLQLQATPLLDLSGFSPGIYFIHILSDGSILHQQKFVIIR